MRSAFISLGFLIGNLVGFTADSVVGGVLGLLFAFGGGSAIALVKQLDERQQKRAFQAIACLALSCLAGLYLAIVLSEFQLLTPREQAAVRSSVEERKYLRSDTLSAAGSIDSQRRTGALECDEAYARLLALIAEEQP